MAGLCRLSTRVWYTFRKLALLLLLLVHINSYTHHTTSTLSSSFCQLMHTQGHKHIYWLVFALSLPSTYHLFGFDEVWALIDLTLFSEPILFFDCNIHPREWISSSSCLYIIQVKKTRFISTFDYFKLNVNFCDQALQYLQKLVLLHEFQLTKKLKIKVGHFVYKETYAGPKKRIKIFFHFVPLSPDMLYFITLLPFSVFSIYVESNFFLKITET